MRKLFAAIALVAVGTTIVGCSAADNVNTKADKSGHHAKNHGKDAAKKNQGGEDGSSDTAQVGDPITIKGMDDGSEVQVTAVKVLPVVQSTDQFSKPSAGHRYVGVQFRLHNTGTSAYNDAPSNGAVVIDSKGQQYETTIMVDSIGAGPLLPSQTKVVPGGNALGFLVFEVPVKVKITQVQFGMDSGFGDSAQWEVS